MQSDKDLHYLSQAKRSDKLQFNADKCGKKMCKALEWQLVMTASK